MTGKQTIFLALLLGLIGQAAFSLHPWQGVVQSQALESPARNFEVQKLAEGIYAVIRKDLPGLMVDANNLFIINDDDVVVVDANGAPAITKEVLAALRKLTSKPVKYVINTHYHDDHIRGNQV